MTEIAKRKATDYAGIAALITAAGGLITLLLTQSHQEERASLMQESVLAVIQYRIEDLEEVVEKQGDELVKLRVELARRRGSRIAPTSPEMAPQPPPEKPDVLPGGEAATKPGEALRDVVDRIQAKKPIRVQDLRAVIQQTGKSLSSEDLER